MILKTAQQLFARVKTQFALQGFCPIHMKDFWSEDVLFGTFSHFLII